MQINHIDNFKNNWILGDFEPSLVKTKDFELAIHHLDKGHKSDGHYHTVPEINIIISGKINTGSQILNDGNIFIFEPHERTNLEFLEDTVLVIIKIPSKPGDKYWT